VGRVGKRRQADPEIHLAGGRRAFAGDRPMTFDAIETRAVEAIRHADHFTASLFLGRGQYRVERRPTVLAAMQAATRDRERSRRAYAPRAHLRHRARRSRHATDRRANCKTAFPQIVRINRNGRLIFNADPVD
jgi:hypothetical protein